ncbi:MAG: hypothetical protein ACJ0S4_02930 [Candidatus Rariloculaceae bacterium]
MKDLWRLGIVFVDIALHRRGPEHIPSSAFLFGLLTTIYLIVSIVATQVAEPFPQSRGHGHFRDTLLLSRLYLVAVINSIVVPDRFYQTVSAIFGAQTFLTLIGIPILISIGIESGEIETFNVGSWLFFILILWSIDIAKFCVVTRATIIVFLGCAYRTRVFVQFAHAWRTVIPGS